ncbi:MAG TPA: DHH family phosphoesterase [Candidatus Lokiarchaeia archaeon]|nr:DHH family phosphoesterase [Candidatus Lokiarchaeia archaeon]
MEMSREFWWLIAPYERILLATHQQADLDAIAAVLALKHFISENNPEKNVMAFWNGTKAVVAKFFAETLAEVLVPLPNPTEIDLCILVDVNNSARVGAGNFFENYSGPVFVIDHHAKPTNLPETVIYSYLDPARSACVEVVYDLIPKGMNPIPSGLRKAMIAGIYTDSQKFSLCDRRSFQILADLFGTDLKLIDITKSLVEETQPSEKIARLKGIQRATIQREKDWIIATTQVSSFEAKVAGGLISAGADIALVVSKQKQGYFRIIGRASPAAIKRTGINLGMIFQSIYGGELESAGGHEGAAGILLNGNPNDVVKEILKQVQETLTRF